MTTVTMDEKGALVIPEEAREALGISGDAEFEVEVSDDRMGFVLRYRTPDDDSWAYTEEHRASVRRAEEDLKAGRVFSMSEAELRRVIGLSDDE